MGSGGKFLHERETDLFEQRERRFPADNVFGGRSQATERIGPVDDDRPAGTAECAGLTVLQDAAYFCGERLFVVCTEQNVRSDHQIDGGIRQTAAAAAFDIAGKDVHLRFNTFQASESGQTREHRTISIDRPHFPARSDRMRRRAREKSGTTAEIGDFHSFVHPRRRNDAGRIEKGFFEM